MALQIKRNNSAVAKVPTGLALAEPAFDQHGKKLYIGGGASAIEVWTADRAGLIPIVELTANRLMAVADNHGLFRMNGFACTLNASMPVGWRVDFMGPGEVVAPVILSIDDLVNVVDKGAASAIHLGGGEFWLIGALE